MVTEVMVMVDMEEVTDMEDTGRNTAVGEVTVASLDTMGTSL